MRMKNRAWVRQHAKMDEERGITDRWNGVISTKERGLIRGPRILVVVFRYLPFSCCFQIFAFPDYNGGCSLSHG